MRIWENVGKLCQIDISQRTSFDSCQSQQRWSTPNANQPYVVGYFIGTRRNQAHMPVSIMFIAVIDTTPHQPLRSRIDYIN